MPNETTKDEHAKLAMQFDNIMKYFLPGDAVQGHVPDAWKTPEERAAAEMEPDHTDRAQNITPDIVENLRWWASNPVDGSPSALLENAADEIERLRSEVNAFQSEKNLFQRLRAIQMRKQQS